MLTDVQKWLVVVSILFCGVIFYLLVPILAPFLVSILLAYLSNPLATRLKCLGCSRTVAVLLIFAFLISVGIGLVLIIIPLLEEQIRALILRFPAWMVYIQENYLVKLDALFGVEIVNLDIQDFLRPLLDNWRDVSSIVENVLTKFSGSGRVLLIWFSYLLIVLVVTFYLLRDWDLLMNRLVLCIPPKFRALVTDLIKQCDEVLAAFLRGQLLVMFFQGLIYTLGLWMVGIEFALLIGMGAGLVSFIPYLGAVLGISVSGLVALLQFQEWIYIVYVLCVFTVGQIIESVVLSPLLVGKRIGLHPVVVIFAVMAGGQLLGFVGVLIALPAAAVIAVLLRFAYVRYQDLLKV